MKNSNLLHAAMTSLLALGAASVAMSVSAEEAKQEQCAGVIKADAYGLGLAPIAKALTSEGCKTFFVATVEEGRAARAVQPGATIYVLDGLLPGAEPHYAGFDLRPVLSSLAEVRDWASYSRARGRKLSAAVHLDTGMNRLGMPEPEIERLAAEPGLNPYLNPYRDSTPFRATRQAPHRPTTPSSPPRWGPPRARRVASGRGPRRAAPSPRFASSAGHGCSDRG